MTLQNNLIEHQDDGYWKVSGTRWSDGTETYLVEISDGLSITILGEPTHPIKYSMTYLRNGRPLDGMAVSGGQSDINMSDTDAQRSMARFLTKAHCPNCNGRLFRNSKSSYACTSCMTVAAFVDEKAILSFAELLVQSNQTTKGYSFSIDNILDGLLPITAEAGEDGRYLIGNWQTALLNASNGVCQENRKWMTKL